MLTNGTTVDVSSKHHPDLLWAVQGASKLSAYPCQSDELIHRWRRWFSCSSVVRLSAISSYTACVLQAAERVGCNGTHQMANVGSCTGALAVAYLLSACSTASLFTFLAAAICFMARMPHHSFRHGIRWSIQVRDSAESHVAVLYLLQLLPTVHLHGSAELGAEDQVMDRVQRGIGNLTAAGFGWPPVSWSWVQTGEMLNWDPDNKPHK